MLTASTKFRMFVCESSFRIDPTWMIKKRRQNLPVEATKMVFTLSLCLPAEAIAHSAHPSVDSKHQVSNVRIWKFPPNWSHVGDPSILKWKAFPRTAPHHAPLAFGLQTLLALLTLSLSWVPTVNVRQKIPRVPVSEYNDHGLTTFFKSLLQPCVPYTRHTRQTQVLNEVVARDYCLCVTM